MLLYVEVRAAMTPAFSALALNDVAVNRGMAAT